MAGGKSQRRVATVLFVDVVESTRVAAEVGDRRWRELVGAFRAAVRRELKRYSGHEVDTAGDGFFAWFESPANALRAAAAIAAEVQSLGLDVRCGLHTGELEQIDGHLGGIAAHIGARVMATAGPAEILATSTVRDLVVGGDISFEAFAEVELKGVPGRWALHRVTRVAGQAVVKPLTGDMAAERLSAPSPAARNRPRPALLAAGLGALLIVAGGAWAGGLLGATEAPSPSPSPTAVSAPSPSATLLPTVTPIGTASPKPSPTFPVAVLRIDPFTNEPAEPLRDEHTHSGLNAVLLDNGAFWTEYGGTELVQRDLETGAFIDAIPLWPEQLSGVHAGFGDLWVAHGRPDTLIERIDPLSARTVTMKSEAELFDLAVGDVAVYTLRNDGLLRDIDPATNRLGEPYSTETDTFPAYLDFDNHRLAMFEPREKRVAIFDPLTHDVVDTWDLSRFGRITNVSRDPSTGAVWVLDRTNNTITPFDPTTHIFGASIGVLDVPHISGYGYGSVWVAAGQYVYRIGSTDRSVQKRIDMPEGVYAGSIGVDVPSESVWVSNCYGLACEDR